MRLIAMIILTFCAWIAQASALEVRVAVLRVDYPSMLPLSRLDYPVDDLGFAGGELATQDNNTTGGFLGFEFQTTYVATTPDTANSAMQGLLDDGYDLFVIRANATDTLRLSDMAGPGRLVLNAGARDTALRDKDCRANLLHVAPSHNMVADAAAQFAVWKKWDQWLLVHGSNPDDLLLADAYRHAARKFGAKIVEDREFEDTGGSRRADSGHVMVQRQLPVFMQGAPKHDIVVAADNSEVFGHYLPFHSWEPRPVMGSAGLRPVSFHLTNEAWGASQLQNRFLEQSSRFIREADYEVWLALRVIGEAVTRTLAADPHTIRSYVLGPDFELAAFKGKKVTFRAWNGQLRQPMLLTDSKIMVSVSPQDGFLHHTSPLDTLGLDAPEAQCSAFKEVSQ